MKRSPSALSTLMLALCALLAAACGTSSSTSAAQASSGGADARVGPIPSGDWLTFNDNSARTGVAPASGITTGNARRLTLRKVHLSATVDASPVELHAVRIDGRVRDVVIVTATFGQTIAIDPGSGKILWTFKPPGVTYSTGLQVTTSAPVIDPGRRFVYTASPDGVIHKLSVTTGRQVWARSITFDPKHEKIASALTVSGPYVVAVTGGYIGDIPPYDGHVVTISRSTGAILHVWNTECSSRHALIRAASCSVTNTHGDNAIWGRGGAVIDPGTHRILVATGNGPFDGRTSWGDSVLELTPTASRLLHNWTPTNQHGLEETDTDLGSTSPVVVPAYHGYHLLIQAGKDGLLHLLNLARLDGTTHGAGPRLGGDLGSARAPGGSQVYAQPAVWETGGRILVFAANNSGTSGYELVGGHHPRLKLVWTNQTPGTSPAVSGGLVYVYDQSDGAMAIRRPNGSMVRSMPMASGHWNSPIVVGGRIIEPTGTYFSSGPSVLDIYHLPGR